MKYLIVEEQSTGLESVILFDEILTHKDIAGNHKVLSAGFVRFAPEVSCYGESTSLDIRSKGTDDVVIIKRSLRR